MAEVGQVVDAIFNKKFTRADGKGETSLGALVGYYDANRDKDLDEVFDRSLPRAGGISGNTSLSAVVRYFDANVSKLTAANEAQTKALIGAIAAVSKGEPFDQAKLLASIQSATAAGVKDAISSIDTTITLK